MEMQSTFASGQSATAFVLARKMTPTSNTVKQNAFFIAYSFLQKTIFPDLTCESSPL